MVIIMIFSLWKIFKLDSIRLDPNVRISACFAFVSYEASEWDKTKYCSYLALIAVSQQLLEKPFFSPLHEVIV